MPPKGKRHKKRRRKGGYNKMRLSRAPITKTMIVPFKYCEDITLNPGISGVPDIYEFNANSIYDPNRTGIGHQPSGYDQWTSFYQHSNVISSKISVNYCSYTTGGTQGTIVCGITYYDVSGNLTGLTGDAIREQPGSVWKLCGIAGSGPVTVNKTFSYKKTFGKSHMDDKNQGVMGNTGVGSNPPEDCIFGVWAYPGDATTDASALYAQVTIEYLVSLSEAKSLPQS